MIRITILLAFVSAPLFAQLSVREFLITARTDTRLTRFDKSLDYLGGKPYRLSPVQRLEFRTQNRELEPTQQEFALRLTPANPWEVRNNNTYFKTYTNVLSFQRQLILQQAYSDRYRAVVDYIVDTERRKLTKGAFDNVNEQLAILEKQIGSSYFDPDDYLDSQLDLVEASADYHNEVVNESGAVKNLRYLAGNVVRAFDWELSDLISVDRLTRVVDSLQSASVSTLSQTYQRERIKLAQSEYKVEKSNINAGFIQGEFDNRRVEQERTPFNISLGVTIPIFNPNKPDMTKRKLEEIEAANKLAEQTSENQYEMDLLTAQINNNVAAYRSISEQLLKLEESDAGKTLSALKGSDPRVMVRYFGSTLKLKQVQLKIYQLILNDYIDFIALTGGLDQVVPVNFLSEKLERLD